jgi:hypothetical protein
MDPFDRWLLLRTLGWVAIGYLLASGIVISTDEAFSTASMRLARLCAFAPGLVAIAVAAAHAQATARGEFRALAALGASPWRLARGSMLCGWGVGCLAVMLLMSRWADVSALFPAFGPAHVWLPLGAALAEPFQGVVVEPGGDVYWTPRGGSPTTMAPSASVAVASVAPLAAVVPVWMSAPLGLLTRLTGAGAALFLAVVLLHAVAAGRVPELTVTLAAAPLLAQATVGHRRARVRW